MNNTQTLSVATREEVINELRKAACRIMDQRMDETDEILQSSLGIRLGAAHASFAYPDDLSDAEEKLSAFAG